MRRALLLVLLGCGRTEVVAPGVAVVNAAPPAAAPAPPRCGSNPVVSCGVPPPTCAASEQPEVVSCDGGPCGECNPHFSGRCVPCTS